MKIAEYERLILSAAMVDRGALYKLAAELSETAFGYGPDDDTLSDAHKLIYRAILKVFYDNHPVDVGTVCAQLGHDLSLVGGQAYLVTIAKTLSTLGIASTEGLVEWVTISDNAGRVRAVRGVLSTGLERLQDVNGTPKSVEDVDIFLASVVEHLSKAGQAKTSYQPIAEIAESYERSLDLETEGGCSDWFPMGWPSLTPYKLFPKASMVIVSALSSMGKSQFLAEAMLGTAIQLRRNNLPGILLLNTYEMNGERYVARMASCLSRVNLLDAAVLDKTSREYRRLQEAIVLIKSLPIIICDSEGMTSSQILGQVLKLNAEQGPVVMVGIDYAELVPDVGANSEELRVSGIFRNCQRLSRMGPSVVVLSQVSNVDMSTKIAPPGSTRYTRAGWHAADLSIYIYNPVQMRKAGISFTFPDFLPDPNSAYIIVGKNKYGKTGWIKLDWTPGYVRFADPALDGELFEGMNELRGDF
jgi:replicative DNA helicase